MPDSPGAVVVMTPYERRAELIGRAISQRYASHADFATSIGVSRVTLYQILNGHSRGSAEMIQRIADALNLESRDLLIPLTEPRITERARKMVETQPRASLERARLVEACAGTKFAATVFQCHDILYGPNADLAEKLRVNLSLLHRSLYRRPEDPADIDARETTTKG